MFLGKLSLAHESLRSVVTRRGKEFNAETTRRTSEYKEQVESKIIMARYKEQKVTCSYGVQKNSSQLVYFSQDGARNPQ